MYVFHLGMLLSLASKIVELHGSDLRICPQIPRLRTKQSLLPLAFPREFPDPVPASSRNTAFVLLLKSMKMAFQSWADLSKGLFQFTLGGVGWDGGRTRSKNNTNIGWSLYTKLPQTPLQQNASSMESNTFCLYCNIHSKHFLIKNKCIMIYKNGNTFSHFYTYCEENTVKILRRSGKNDGMSLLNWWMDPLNRVSYMQSTHHP